MSIAYKSTHPNVAWDITHDRDLLTFYTPPPDQGIFASWLASYPITLYHRFWGRRHNSGRIIDPESGLVEYIKSRLHKIAKLISTKIASTMPMIAILGLYFENGLLRRIYIAIGITAAFAGVLSVFSSARRLEIFAPTAAMAAVEVVLIGNTERT